MTLRDLHFLLASLVASALASMPCMALTMVAEGRQAARLCVRADDEATTLQSADELARILGLMGGSHLKLSSRKPQRVRAYFGAKHIKHDA